MVELLRVQTNFSGQAVTGPAVAHHMFLAGITPQGAANAIHALWQALNSEISSQCNIDIDPSVQHIESTTGLVVDESTVTASPLVGADTNNVLPKATQGQIQWRTSSFVNGKRLQGRTFIPGPTTGSATAQGAPTVGYLEDLATGAAALEGNPDFVVYSPTHKTFAVVTSARVFQKFAVLRSRRD